MNHDNFVLLVVVSIHANLQGIDFDSTEDVIITRITELLNGRSPEDSSRILEGAQIRIFGARKGQSVVIYIFCKTLSDLLDLKEMHVSGELTTHLRAMFSQIISRSHCVDVNAENLSSVVESVFEELFHRTNVAQLDVTFYEWEFEKCLSYFPR